MSERTLKVAVLGCGAVGSQVVRLLHEQAGDLAARVGRPVELAGVAVRRIDAPRDVDLPEGLRTFVSVDGGMSDNIRTALYDADYTVTLASRASDDRLASTTE